MSDDLCRMLVEDFLKSSWQPVEAIVEKLKCFRKREIRRKSVSMFRFENASRSNL